MKENRVCILPILCARGVIYGFKVKVQTFRDKFISVFSYPETNGVEAGIQFSSRLLGIKIQVPAGMAKVSINLEKINKFPCSLLLLNLSVPGLNSLLGTGSIQNPAEEAPDRKFEERMTTIEGNNLSEFT